MNPATTVNAAIVVIIGSTFIPKGVKYRSRPKRGTTATLRPKERAVRSIQSIVVSSGKSAATSK